MILKMLDIPEGHSDFSLECDLGSIKDDLPPLCGTMHCEGDINRLGADIFIHIHYNGMFVLECARCLENYNAPISGELQVTVREASGRHGKSTDEEEMVDFYFDSTLNDELDLSAALLDEIIIETPIKPLCRKDCKGVEIKDKDIVVDFDGAPKKNVPIEKEIDPRWEALKKLKK
ncbi:MAG: YceD family protein [Fibrobacterota bacterium]